MDTRKVYLEENRNVNSVNKENFVGVNLTTKSKLLPYNNISDILNLNELYTEERNSCRKYRLILTVNPICTNILFNYRTEVVRHEGSDDCELVLNEPEPIEYTLNVSPTELIFEDTGGSQTIVITTQNQGWRIVNSCDNWFTISQTSGDEGSSTITITAEENPNEEERSCQFTVKGYKQKQETVIVKQLLAIPPGIVSLRIELDFDDIPASGGSVYFNSIYDNNIRYKVYGVYEDSTETELPNSELQLSFTNVSAESKRDNVDEDGQHTEVQEATLTVVYNDITGTETKMVYQQANILEKTWEYSGRTNENTSGWTVEGREYYDIEVNPTSIEFPNTGDERDIEVYASAITATTIYSADTWQEQIDPWSAYTSTYSGQGETIILEEVHVENERVVKEEDEFGHATPVYVEVEQNVFEIGPLNGNTQHVSASEYDGQSERRQILQYYVEEDSEVTGDCLLKQSGMPLRKVTIKFGSNWTINNNSSVIGYLETMISVTVDGELYAVTPPILELREYTLPINGTIERYVSRTTTSIELLLAFQSSNVEGELALEPRSGWGNYGTYQKYDFDGGEVNIPMKLNFSPGTNNITINIGQVDWELTRMM